MSRYRWVEPSRTAAGLELAQLGLVGDILAARGITDIAEAMRFMQHGLADLPDPSTLPDIEAATSRILHAIQNDERIAIFGDYDVDGVTSTALLATALGNMGASVLTYLPNRVRDGYGLNIGAVERAAMDGCKLLVTVDCGTGNAFELNHAASLGLDTIVIDHHHVANNDLPAHAFVSPKRGDSNHEFDDYAAVGVTFQLLRYLTDGRGVDRFLPLVALGTVADVVPLVGPNRMIVHNGLERFRDEAGPGLLALADSAGLRGDRLTSHHLGFLLGPRINAAGRIDDPRPALDLLMTESIDDARRIAERLSRLNTQRQSMLEESVAEARMLVEDDGLLDQPVLVLHSPDWHIGLVGLIASRVSEQYGRPVVALEEGWSLSRGSARSTDEFNVVVALERCAELLHEYGGHSKAAGLTIRSEAIGEFTERINELFRAEIGPDPPAQSISLDAEIAPEVVSPQLLEELACLEPFGHGNPSPLFLMRDVLAVGAKRSRNQAHLLFNVAGRAGGRGRAVSFGNGDRLPELGSMQRIDLALSLRPNTWQGRFEVTLEAHDFRPTSVDPVHR